MTDEAPANSTYLVLLYMALGRHVEAAEVAVGLARRAQEAGNYKACTSSGHWVSHLCHCHVSILRLIWLAGSKQAHAAVLSQCGCQTVVISLQQKPQIAFVSNLTCL